MKWFARNWGWLVVGCLWCFMLGDIFFLPGEAQAGGRKVYGARYWWGGGYDHGTYYSPGYYRDYHYEEEYTVPILVTSFYNTQYVPVSFSTYQPASVSQYQTSPLATTAQLQAIAPPQSFQGQAQVTQQGFAVQQGGVVAAQQQPITGNEAHNASLLLILKKLEAMDARLLAVEGRKQAVKGQEDQPMPKAVDEEKRVEAPTANLVVLRCAKCHTEGTASKPDPKNPKATVGGGKVFFAGEGNTAKLNVTDKQLNKMTFAVLRGEMPKDAKLEDKEGQAILAILESTKTIPQPKGE